MRRNDRKATCLLSLAFETIGLVSLSTGGGEASKRRRNGACLNSDGEIVRFNSKEAVHFEHDSLRSTMNHSLKHANDATFRRRPSMCPVAWPTRKTMLEDRQDAMSRIDCFPPLASRDTFESKFEWVACGGFETQITARHIEMGPSYDTDTSQSGTLEGASGRR